MEAIQPWQIDSFLLAMHNIARALGVIALILALYPWLGGFEGKSKHTVRIIKDPNDDG